jgi:colanic acid/amylovoran biosynthesis glycosyltransferase
MRRQVLIGNPGKRRSYSGADPLPTGLVPRALRRIRRSLSGETVLQQDKRGLVDYFRQHEVDVVLAEYGTTAMSVMDACREADLPLVVHFHGWDAYKLPRDPEIHARYQQLFKQAAAVVGVSTHMVRELERIGAPPERTSLNACGVEVPERTARPAEAPPVFVAVGRFTPKKAPFLTLIAFAHVRRRVPDATLEMFGDGELLEPCGELAYDLGVQDAVTFHGAVSHDVVFDQLRKARCFVQHSVVARDGDAEGTPVSVLEAMAVGLPVVATRHMGIADVVEEGRSGFLVDEFDVEGMAGHMLELAQDSVKAASFGQRARELVLESYTMESSVERLAGIIRAGTDWYGESAPE